MPNEFPPLTLPDPQFARRRPGTGRRPPLPPEIIERRAEIAARLGTSVSHLSRELRSLTEEQRKAVFYKLTHDGPVDLSGTSLRPMAERRDDRVTLAVPTADNLDALATKISQFGRAKPKGEGYLPNQDLARIESISAGDPKDRLSDALFAQYDALISRPFVLCEVELASRESLPKRRRVELEQLIGDLHRALIVDGAVFEHEEIDGSCRAVIRCSGSRFQQLVEGTEWQTKIVWFDARPEFETFQTVFRSFNVASLGPIEPPPSDAPTVCVIDSGVTVGNPFLTPTSHPDLLRSFLNGVDDPSDGYGHGSGVASLAAYYNVDISPRAKNASRVWIASARILNNSNELDDERLFSRLLGQVVETFVPRGVRIFVLAVGDSNKPWAQSTRRTLSRKSWVARAIDRLSREHDILFVTCTGNLTCDAIKRLIDEGHDYPRYLATDEACILDPGQAALSLTVGSIAHTTTVVSSPAVAIAERDHPSPFTRSGPGIRQEIKPELVDYGGNAVLDAQLRVVRANAGTNVVVASHQLSPAIALSHGVSFAAPRVAHKAARILHDLESLGLSVTAPLLKAFLVNSAQMPLSAAAFDHLKAEVDQVKSGHCRNLMGYGVADATRATESDFYSAILYYHGTMEADYVAFFDIPVPATLAAAKQRKRISVTVCHYPEVQRWGLEQYLGTDLKWRLFRGDAFRDEIVSVMSADENASESETQSEQSDVISKELKGQWGVQTRSRGAVQHDVFEWARHLESYSDNHYTLAVAAFSRWNRKTEALPIGIVVRIEDLGHEVSVYNEIRASVEVNAARVT